MTGITAERLFGWRQWCLFGWCIIEGCFVARNKECLQRRKEPHQSSHVGFTGQGLLDGLLQAGKVAAFACHVTERNHGFGQGGLQKTRRRRLRDELAMANQTLRGLHFASSSLDQGRFANAGRTTHSDGRGKRRCRIRGILILCRCLIVHLPQLLEGVLALYQLDIGRVEGQRGGPLIAVLMLRIVLLLFPKVEHQWKWIQKANVMKWLNKRR